MKYDIGQGHQISPKNMALKDIAKYLYVAELSEFEGLSLDEVEVKAKTMGDEIASELSEIIYPRSEVYDSDEIYLQNWNKCLETCKEIYSDLFVQEVITKWKSKNPIEDMNISQTKSSKNLKFVSGGKQTSS